MVGVATTATMVLDEDNDGFGSTVVVCSGDDGCGGVDGLRRW